MEQLPDVIAGYTGIVINSKIKMTPAIARQGCSIKILLAGWAQVWKLSMCLMQHPKAYHASIHRRAIGDAVAEHAIGMLFVLNNNLIQADAEVRKNEWHREKTGVLN